MPHQSTPNTYQSPKTTNWPMIILGILGVIIVIGIFFVIAVNKDVTKSDLSRRNISERGSSVLDPYLKNYEEEVILDSENDVEESVVEEWTVFSTIDLKANNQSVGQGGFIILSANQSLDLSWSSSLPSPSTASCSLSGWGSVPLNGLITYTPAHSQYPSASGKTYTLTCSSANVTISDSVTVGFGSGFSTIDLKANNQLVGQGGFIILSANQSLDLSWNSSWSSSSTASCNLSGWGIVPLNGLITYTPTHSQYPSASGKTYTLTCSSADVTISDSVTVTPLSGSGTSGQQFCGNFVCENEEKNGIREMCPFDCYFVDAEGKPTDSSGYNGFIAHFLRANSTFNPDPQVVATSRVYESRGGDFILNGFLMDILPQYTNGVLSSSFQVNDGFRKEFCSVTQMPTINGVFQYRMQIGLTKRVSFQARSNSGGMINGVPINLRSSNPAIIEVTPAKTFTGGAPVTNGQAPFSGNVEAPAVFTITAKSLGTTELIATSGVHELRMSITVKKDTVKENWLCESIIKMYVDGTAREITALNGVSPGGETYTLPSSIANKNMSVVTNRTATCKASTQRRTEFSDMPLTFATTDGKTHTFQLGTQGIYYRCKETASGIADAFDYYLT